jgi:predicted Rossmann fold nucleotide-binding protein DprA/Smf involved in DNA uptake
MPSRERTYSERLIAKGSPEYPDRLVKRLGADAPKFVTVIGAGAPLLGPITAFLCSKETPGATILKAFDQAAAWRDAGRCVISGFHSPLEKECLAILLRGRQPVLLSPARGIGSMRLPAEQRRAVEDSRLTIISPFAPEDRRASADLGRRRNRFIMALADEIVFGFVAPGGSLARLRGEILSWNIPVRELHTQ